MKTTNHLLRGISFGSGLALALSLAAYFSNAARAAEHDPKMGKIPAGAMPGAQPVGTGKDEGKGEAVKHICSKCGDEILHRQPGLFHQAAQRAGLDGFVHGDHYGAGFPAQDVRHWRREVATLRKLSRRD